MSDDAVLRTPHRVEGVPARWVGTEPADPELWCVAGCELDEDGRCPTLAAVGAAVRRELLAYHTGSPNSVGGAYYDALAEIIAARLGSAGLLAASPAQTDGEREWRVAVDIDGRPWAHVPYASRGAAAAALLAWIAGQREVPESDALLLARYVVQIESRECGPWSPVPSPETGTPESEPPVEQ